MLDSLPLLLLLVPLLAALLIRVLSRFRASVAAGVGAVILLLFYLLLASLPLGFTASPTIEWVLWGQSWLLTWGTWIVLRLLYLGAAFLFLLAAVWPDTLGPPAKSAPTDSQAGGFVAAGLVVLSPLAASLMLPSTLATVTLLLAAIPLLSMLQPATDATASRATIRYFILTTLAIPFLLLAGWMALSEQLVFVSTVWRLLLIGLALLLAGFPFHIWVRPLVAAAPPLLLPFLFGLVHLVLLVFTFRFLHETASLEGNRQFYSLLRWTGVGTAVVGSLLAWKPCTRGRLVGALVLLDLGTAIVALSLGVEGIRPTLLLLLGRFISLLLVLTGLALLRRHPSNATSLPVIVSLSRLPWAQALFLYGALSLLGLPLTPGFAGRWALFSLTASRSLWPAFVLLLALAVGTAGLFAFLRSPAPPPPARLSGGQPLSLPLQAFSFLLLATALLITLFPSPLVVFAANLAQRLS